VREEGERGGRERRAREGRERGEGDRGGREETRGSIVFDPQMVQQSWHHLLHSHTPTLPHTHTHTHTYTHVEINTDDMEVEGWHEA
jgi:hypothetical protein